LTLRTWFLSSCAFSFSPWISQRRRLGSDGEKE
jgi:hypothetical protein